MALLRCLCLVLTVWMVGSSPGAAVRTGSSDSVSWWGSPASLQIRENASALRQSGDFAAAEGLYQQGYQEAPRHDAYARVRYLASIGGCRLVLLRYREALDAFLEARSLAESAGDRLGVGLIAVNLSSTFLQMWDLVSAVQAAEQARAAIQGLPPPEFKAGLLLQLGRLHTTLADNSAEAFLAEGIEAARQQGDIATEAKGWDLLGEERLRQRRLPEAERALTEAFRLRELHFPAGLGLSYGRLAALKLEQGQIETAARFNRRAGAAAAGGGLALPEHLLRHQRGEIRLARGDVDAALSDFAAALDLADRWRTTVLPAMSSLTGANVDPQQQIFPSFVEVAAHQALTTGSARRAAESFAAVEMNRAASLRASLALSEVWRNRLPAEYWATLGQLTAENARLLPTAAGTSAEAERLQLRLTEMESQAGLSFAVKKGEIFRNQSSLTLFQSGLGSSELLLSFHLGGSESYLWALTRSTLSLYRLAPAGRIREAVEKFREAVRSGWPAVGADVEQLGAELYAELFGQLKPSEIGQRAWLLSLDDSLFELPFAALVPERKGGKAVYLVERHSLQVVPGALSLSRTRGKAPRHGWFLGVGDPIYNVADPRWRTASPASGRGPGILGFLAAASDGAGELGRLVASAGEVEAGARSWQAGSGTATVLEGESARRGRFLDSLAQSPAVVHLATHVLTPPRRRQQAFLALGLDAPARMGLLGTSEVAMLHVPGSLVVMTGCATASGDAQAGAGLLGLTRAWLIAGAGAVVATGWPVKDSPGDFFSRFYSNLRQESAAEALRETQVEMVRSGTWRAAPAFWASYQVTGSSR